MKRKVRRERETQRLKKRKWKEETRELGERASGEKEKERARGRE